MASADQPLIVIVGPTASGKTALAVELALECQGEIICADSRTVYRGMDIGTAKPTSEERRRVRHHLLDIVEPDEPFSVADFQRLAQAAIEDVRRRGKVPFLVGGSGLYVDSIIFSYEFGSPPDAMFRKQLLSASAKDLRIYCLNNNIELPENDQNKRYLIRAIEQNGVNRRRRLIIIDNCIVVGITTDKEILKDRIVQRADQLFRAGMLNEALEVAKKYGWNSEAMTGNIYQLAAAIHKGELSIDEARGRFITLDWQLAKRQITWFKRNPFIHWGSVTEVAQMIRGYLK